MNKQVIPTSNIQLTALNKPKHYKVWDIHGGVHPPENKTQSMRLPLADIAIAEELIFPVSQHLGNPAAPIVSVGDRVLAGEKIAEAVGVMSVPIHASTSGTITAIEDRVLPHASGMSGLCIVLQSDGKHESIETSGFSDYQSLKPSELVNKIRDAGIAGLGGAGFPTSMKLNPRAETPIDTLILNGTECEPYITADDRLMQDYAKDVVCGAQLFAYILGGPAKVIIGIEDNKPDAIAAIQQAVHESEKENTNNSFTIEVLSFPTKYPSGGEKQLIQILTGKEVPSGKIPAHLGIVLQNVGTARAAYRAVAYGESLTWRITTVVGEALDTQRNIKALIGTPVRHILNEHGFEPDHCSKLVMGGPMMGFALPSADVPLVKTTNCIIAPSKTEMPPAPPAQPCIRCGICAEACPVSLLPQQLYWYAKAEDYERLQNHNLFDCIECGACSYVCPSFIPLVQYYRGAKGKIRQQQKEKVKSDHARKRFELHKFRMEKEKQEKEEKRLARKQAAEQSRKLAAEKKAGLSKPSNDNASHEDNSSKEAPMGSDLVAAAISRVQQQDRDPVAQKAKLERAVNSAQNRVEKLQQRLNEAEEDQKDKLSAQLKQAQTRLQDAEKNLTSFSIDSEMNEKRQTTESATIEHEKDKSADITNRPKNGNT